MYKTKWCNFLVFMGLKFGFKHMTLFCPGYIKTPRQRIRWHCETTATKADPGKDVTLSVIQVWNKKIQFKMRK